MLPPGNWPVFKHQSHLRDKHSGLPGKEITINRLSAGDVAPDFTLPDHEGVQYRLSDIRRTQTVLLVFNLGFV